MHQCRLHEKKLVVTSDGWHVNEKIIELAPLHIAQELGDDLHDDRSAPDRRLIALDHESKAHDFDSVCLERNDLLVLDRRWSVDTHHARDVRSIDVGIYQSDTRTLFRQSDRKIRGDGGFSNASLSAGDCDDVSQVRVRDGRRRWNGSAS